jgi:hypothetical protein
MVWITLQEYYETFKQDLAEYIIQISEKRSTLVLFLKIKTPLKVIIKINEHQIYCVCHHPPLYLIGVLCFLDKHISTLKRTEEMDSQ